MNAATATITLPADHPEVARIVAGINRQEYQDRKALVDQIATAQADYKREAPKFEQPVTFATTAVADAKKALAEAEDKLRTAQTAKARFEAQKNELVTRLERKLHTTASPLIASSIEELEYKLECFSRNYQGQRPPEVQAQFDRFPQARKALQALRQQATTDVNAAIVQIFEDANLTWSNNRDA